MKTIKTRKEEFDFDGILNKIEKSIFMQEMGAEGIVHPAIMDCINNETLKSTSKYDDIDFELTKKEFYDGNLGLALIFATADEDNNVSCVNDRVYEIDNMDVGEFGIDIESCGVIYLNCQDEDMCISTAYYGGGSCMFPPTLKIEENWGELDKDVIEFLNPFLLA